MTVRLPLLLAASSLLLAAQAYGQGGTAIRAVRVASGLSSPTFVCSPPGDEDRLFVLEKDVARIRIIKDGTLLPSPFLDIFSKVQGGGERGLLGLAFDPLYAVNGFFYVSYTRRPDGASILERYRVSANPDVADFNSGTVGFGPVSQPFSNHNGGCIQFGPDGRLYFGLGDGGSGGDPQCHAQNKLSLLGKILRLDVGTIPFSAPPDNPFFNNAAYRPEIWHLGVRNPWRFSFDSGNGAMYIGDVGQNAWEEISYQAPATGGLNYGWRVMEGLHCYGSQCNGSPPCNDPSLTLPIHEYANGSNCSVTGGYVYRGCSVPDLQGTYFFGDYCTGRIWSFRWDGANKTEFRDRTAEGLGFSGSLSSFGEDARGELYLVSLNGGAIWRIQAADGGPAVDIGNGKVGGNGEIPRLELCGRLEAGMSAELILRRAPAMAPVAVAVSTSNNPTPMFGGTLVPVPPQLVLAMSTGADGRATMTIPGGLGSAVLYLQAAMGDPGATFGIGISNALAVTFP